jgi:hypothetical protein
LSAAKLILDLLAGAKECCGDFVNLCSVLSHESDHSDTDDNKTASDGASDDPEFTDCVL